MASEQFFIQELPNGLTLLGQRMEVVSSAAMSLLVRAGAAYDPPAAEGSGAIASEWLLRGAGNRGTRELHDALDALGCQHDESPQSEHIHFSSAQLGRNLPEVLAIYADILRRPKLEDATFEQCRALTLQDLASLEDEPGRKCNMLLRERFYPYPLGRCVYGRQETLESVAAQQVRGHLQSRLTPHGAVLAVAGNIDWEKFVALAKQLFGDWQAPLPPDMPSSQLPPGETHIAKETAQTHIAFAHAAVTMDDPRYYDARLAEMILSGGMSSRLFTEVREKRGLVYGISCRYHTLKGHAGMFTYAGTRPEVAQQTLDVTVGEIRRMEKGVTAEEMARSRTQLKAALIMQGESTSARAGAIASDWFHLGRLRSLAEMNEAIGRVRAEDVSAYAKAFPPRELTALVIGPQSLKMPQ